VELASEYFSKIIEKLNSIEKAQAVFETNIEGKTRDWEKSFQFNLDNEDPFYIQIKNRRVQLTHGTNLDAEIVMSGNNSAIVRICEGKGDFTHAISREQITIKKGKVMDVIRLTRAITITLKNK